MNGYQRLAGRHVLVTGCGQGIGQAVAQRLAAEGAVLSLTDIRPDGLAATAASVESAGAGETKVLRADALDLTDSARVRELVAVVDDERPLDGLVQVAGVGLCAQFLDLELDQWRRTIDVNLTATFVLCQAVGARMAARGNGRIVTMASIAGKTGSETLADYCASKAGVISLTQSASRALGPRGVTVNAVCPGLVWTPMWRETATWIGRHDPRLAGFTPEQVYEASVEAMTPMRVPVTVADIAATVAFLLSDDARHITGQAVNVDGGIEVH